MNLNTNKFFVFHFWQKNGVSLTISSTSFKESSVKSSLLVSVEMCLFTEKCNQMLWVTHVCMIIKKSSIASVSKNQNLIKTAQIDRFFTANRSTKYDCRNAFYDPSYILNSNSYKFFYLMVYDKWTFQKKKTLFCSLSK